MHSKSFILPRNFSLTWSKTKFHCGVFGLIAMSLVSSSSLQNCDSCDTKEIRYESKSIAGWTLFIHEKLLENQLEKTTQAIDLLAAQLEEIVRVVPPSAMVELRKVQLWMSPEYPRTQPRAEYHPGENWLRENHRNPEMVKGVEFTNVAIFEKETKRMPNFALHELAHAYHDRVLQDGFQNQELRDLYAQAIKEGKYERVEQRFGDGRSENTRAYAMTNSQEYFAECSEAYFSNNDFFPFDRKQLEKHDPRMFELLGRLWGK